MFSLCRWENALAVNYLDVAAVCICIMEEYVYLSRLQLKLLVILYPIIEYLLCVHVHIADD